VTKGSATSFQFTRTHIGPLILQLANLPDTLSGYLSGNIEYQVTLNTFLLLLEQTIEFPHLDFNQQAIQHPQRKTIHIGTSKSSTKAKINHLIIWILI